MSKTIIIKHVTGEYKLPLADEDFIAMKSTVIKCIQSRLDALVYRDFNGNENHFPSDLLRHSVITFEENKSQTKMNFGS